MAGHFITGQNKQGKLCAKYARWYTEKHPNFRPGGVVSDIAPGFRFVEEYA
jgi:hypothetical protein